MDRNLKWPRAVEVDKMMLPPHWAEYFAKHSVRMHLIDLTDNSAKNGKIYPAYEIIAAGIARGDHRGSDTVIDSTSGNYGVAVAAVVREYARNDPNFPIKRVVMVVNQSLPKGKRQRLLDEDIELIDAKSSVDAMQVAERTARDRHWWNTRQYWNTDNSAGWRPVAESIASHLPQVGIAAWGVGSGGGCSGVMPVFRDRFKSRSFGLWRVAVVAEDGEKIGGVRDEAALEPGTLEWRGENIDEVRFVTERQSNFFASALWRQGLHVGPSTGFAAEGACLAVRSLCIMRKLDLYRAEDGDVHVLVPSLDRRTPYREEFERMGVYLRESDWQ